MTQPTDILQLIEDFDLRDHVARIWDGGKHRRDYSSYRSRWRNDDDHPSFAVYPNGYKDYGGTYEKGGVLDFLCKEHGWTKREAVDFLREQVGGVLPTARRAEPRQQQQGSPPPIIWQQTVADQVAAECADLLWSNAPAVQDYLGIERGLSESTIRHFQFGYNPAWRKIDYTDENGTLMTAWLAPGITMPRRANGMIYAIRTRSRVGKFAEFLHIHEDRDRDGDPLDKYLSLTGSRPSLVPFNADALRFTPGQPLDVLIVEGEIDAATGQQQLLGNQVAVITMGSASTDIPPEWYETIKKARHVYSCMDADDAGRKATQKLVAALGDRHTAITLPDRVKDLNDAVMKNGLDVPAWWASATADPARQSAAAQPSRVGQIASDQTVPGSQSATPRYFLPYTWRRGIVMINTSGAREKTTGNLGLLLECVIFRGVRDKALNPAGMTFEEVAAFAEHQQGVELSARQLRRVFDELKKVFLTVTDIGIVDDPVSLTVINSLRKAGRPSQRWKLNDLQTAKSALAREMTKKVMERHFAAEDGVIPPLSVLLAALHDNELPHDETVITSLKQALEATGGLDKTAAQKLIADTVADRLIKSLDDHRGEPIPDDFPMKTGEDYLAAHGTLCLKAGYQGDVFLSQKQIGDDLGIASRKVVARLTKRIGVPMQPSGIQEVTLNRDRRIYEQVESVRSKVKGKALSIKAVWRDGTTVRENYSIATAQRLLNEGASVTVAIRTANMYSVTPDIRPLEAAPRVVKPAQHQEQSPAQRTAAPASLLERDDPDRIGHSRVWLRDQLALILSRLDKFEVRGDNLINRETGEITSRSAPVNALLFLLIGCEIETTDHGDYAGDELFAYALREWGDDVRGTRLG